MARQPAAQSPVRAGLRAWFGRPPRRHGEINEHREVSFVELFYDLVYVVLVGQISHAFAGHVSGSAALDFLVLFGLIWIAWINGSGYHELHGREDGRARSYIFGQMLLLAVAAAFAEHATGADGRAFAIVYALLLALLWWQWLEVRLIDEPAYRPGTTPYLVGIGGSVVAMAASAALDSTARFQVWFAVVVVTLGGGFWLLARGGGGQPSAVVVTSSLVERFGLIIIIVLGEVVVSVVRGLAEASRSATTLATGVLSLMIGCGLWWTYFDLLGRQKPRATRGAMAVWVYGHTPVAMAIAATGAGLVGLIGHADDPVTPAAPATLLSVSVAVVLLGVAVLRATIAANDKLPLRLRHVGLSMSAGAVASLGLLAVRPPPWLFALGLAAILTATWFYLFVQAARLLAIPVIENGQEGRHVT